jgi:hypothetical protein
MPNLSGTGGRTSGVNYATAALFDRMLKFADKTTNTRLAAGILATTYQANTGASAGSLKRVRRTLY